MIEEKSLSETELPDAKMIISESLLSTEETESVKLLPPLKKVHPLTIPES